MQIVTVSGYVDSGMVALAKSADVDEVLRKPVTLRDIVEAARESSPSCA